MSAVADRPGSPWRLGRRGRRAALVSHLVASGAWIGIDVVLAVLVGTALLTDDPRRAGLCLSVAGLVAVWPLLVVGLASLASGVVLGAGSRWGVVRYRWVAAKLGINVVLTALIPIALVGNVSAAAVRGAALLDGRTNEVVVGDLVFPPAVSLALLLVAVVLSVVKPWGPVRGGATGSRGPDRSGPGREGRTVRGW